MDSRGHSRLGSALDFFTWVLFRGYANDLLERRALCAIPPGRTVPSGGEIVKTKPRVPDSQRATLPGLFVALSSQRRASLRTTVIRPCTFLASPTRPPQHTYVGKSCGKLIACLLSIIILRSMTLVKQPTRINRESVGPWVGRFDPGCGQSVGWYH